MDLGITLKPAAHAMNMATKNQNVNLGLKTPPSSLPELPDLDVPYTEINLDGKVVGAMGASQPYGFIEDAICRLRYYRSGRTCTGLGLMLIPDTATWPEQDPYFPFSLIGLSAADLPYAPKIYEPVISGINLPNVGDFSLIQTSDGEEDGEGMAIGSVITDFGGSLPNPLFGFFHVSKDTAGGIENLIFDGNQITLIGSTVIVYFKFSYECATALEE